MPKDSTPRPSRTSLIAPPNALAHSSVVTTLTSAILFPFWRLGRNTGRTLFPQRVRQRDIGHTGVALQWPERPARAGSRGRSSDWLERCPVTAEVAGSSP